MLYSIKKERRHETPKDKSTIKKKLWDNTHPLSPHPHLSHPSTSGAFSICVFKEAAVSIQLSAPGIAWKPLAMLGAKPKEKIQQASFTDLQRFPWAQILGSVIKINTLLSISINTKPSNLTDLAFMVREIISPVKLGRVACFGFYDHFILGYIRFTYFHH